MKQCGWVLCCLALEAARTGLIPSREREWVRQQEIGVHLQCGMGFRAEPFEPGEVQASLVFG